MLCQSVRGKLDSEKPIFDQKNPLPAIMLGSVKGRITFYPILTQEASMFRGALEHPTFISLAAIGLATASTLAQAGEIADKLMQKHQCQVIFDNSPTDCVGGPTSRIARGTPGYTVSYDPVTGLVTASGPICNADRSETHPDSGGAPAQGYLNVFGRPFRFDEEGNVYETQYFGGARIGKITCLE